MIKALVVLHVLWQFPNGELKRAEIFHENTTCAIQQAIAERQLQILIDRGVIVAGVTVCFPVKET